MRRILTTVVAATRTVVLLAGTAVVTTLAAQLLPGTAGAQPYPPPESRPVAILVTTPGATVRIVGSNWGPGTRVYITRSDSAQPRAVGTATVQPDGTFAAEIVAPEEIPEGGVEVLASGTDAEGQERTDAYVLSRRPAGVENTPQGGLTVWQVLAIAVVGALLLAAASAGVVRRRSSD
ncbi:MAG TPA: hypothetical protein VHF25_11350 [Nitriliruptorales bacterium]|nr:hypothetical protein [Nitriliruptorales bacterium]